MINWQEVAQNNGLTPEEFKKEIFTIAACLGAMDLDADDSVNAIKFTCSDGIGPLEVYIKRAG